LERRRSGQKEAFIFLLLKNGFHPVFILNYGRRAAESHSDAERWNEKKIKG